ncbi:hypothetical protein AAFN60_11430 [Roseibacillus persicicus]|uniref:Uncharacterized protein n=1 Tax=Roseibacillus persicicus TaxID=454148 RepID=A0A918TY23_9BACT|nr:hypothetical protein [Roseibacillus persicicus]GHC67250.1 hypothetical protein GCM10007100_39130 [Roseibacillus persicicus]
MANELISPKPAVGSLTVHRQSAQTAGFEFIPLPFIDDWLINRERRNLVRKILQQRGIQYDAKSVKILSGSGTSLFGKLGGMAKGLVLKPIIKLYRSVLFWLTIRRAVLTFAETYFLARFLSKPEVIPDGTTLNQAEAKRLADLYRSVVTKLDRRLATEGTKHLWEFMRKKKTEDHNSVSSQEVADAIEKEAPGILADFDRRVTAALQA